MLTLKRKDSTVTFRPITREERIAYGDRVRVTRWRDTGCIGAKKVEEVLHTRAAAHRLIPKLINSGYRDMADRRFYNNV